MNRLRCAAGHALVEVILLLLVTFVPLVSLLGALSRVHRAALAVTAATREAGTAATSATGATARKAATSAAVAAMEDQGLPAASMRISLSTSTRFERGAEIHVRVAYPVPVLGIPFIAKAAGPSIWVRASHTAHVDPYRSAP